MPDIAAWFAKRLITRYNNETPTDMVCRFCNLCVPDCFCRQTCQERRKNPNDTAAAVSLFRNS